MGNQQTTVVKHHKKPKFPFRRKLPLRPNENLHPCSSSTLDLTTPEIELEIEDQTTHPHKTSCIDLNQMLLIDEQPRKLIHKFNDLKRQIWNSNWTVTFSGTNYWTEQTLKELSDLLQKLESFMNEVRMFCSVEELRITLSEKCERLKKQLTDNLQCLRRSNEVTVRTTNHFNVTKKALDVFLETSVRLEAIKERIVEYYGINDGTEFWLIERDLDECLATVLDVKDRGDLRIIVTREEYEDYISAMKEKFAKIVEENVGKLSQDKQIISNVNARRISQVTRVKKASLTN